MMRALTLQEVWQPTRFLDPVAQWTYAAELVEVAVGLGHQAYRRQHGRASVAAASVLTVGQVEHGRRYCGEGQCRGPGTWTTGRPEVFDSPQKPSKNAEKLTPVCWYCQDDQTGDHHSKLEPKRIICRTLKSLQNRQNHPSRQEPPRHRDFRRSTNSGRTRR